MSVNISFWRSSWRRRRETCSCVQFRWMPPVTASTYYDPDIELDPREWRELDDQERVRVVTSYHVQNRIAMADLKSHALMHVNVENMLTQGRGPMMRALVRLQADGLSRHEAIHALAAVWLAYPVDSYSGGAGLSAREKQLAFNQALETLTAEKWRMLHEGKKG